MVRGLGSGDPQLIGPYRLLGELGHGGMGRVFLGLSAGGRPVAVKVIRADLAADAEFRIRFRREVAAARRVSGLFTALVVDADVDGPVPWLATAYVSGPSVAEAVTGHGPMSARSALALAAGLAEGLNAIHAAGVVHCDLKPSNVLLSQDGPRVIDFGISRAVADAALTRAGPVIGSPGYMAPEQALGRDVGPPGDVFSLGAVLAFAAVGRGPFGDGTAPEVTYRVVYGLPDLGDLPGQVRPLVDRCLAKDPARRPTAADVLSEVAALQPATGWLPDSILTAFAQTPWPSPVPQPFLAPPEGLGPPPAHGNASRRGGRPLAAAWAGGGILAAAVAGLILSGNPRHSAATQYQPRASASVSASHRSHAQTSASSARPAAPLPAPDIVPAVALPEPGPPTSPSPSRSASKSPSASRSPSATASPSPSSSPSAGTSSSPSVSPGTSSSPTGSTTPTGPSSSPSGSNVPASVTGSPSPPSVAGSGSPA